MEIKKITPEDFRKAYDSIQVNDPYTEGTKTWYKKLYSFDDGTDLCFCASLQCKDGETGENPEDWESRCKLGCLSRNSAMIDYDWDFVMPYVEDGDVWDTEIGFDGENQSDIDWLNKEAEDIVEAVEGGEILTSACGKKKSRKTKKPIESSVGEEAAEIRKLTNPETFWDDVREIVGYNTGRFHEDWDIKQLQRVADARYDELINSSRRSIKSMARSYLKPEYDSRASFYNKAEVDDDKLYSYGTLVAEIVDGKPVLYPSWNYSQTTMRHVKEFLRQHGFTADSKAQIERDYPVTNSVKRKPVKSAYNPYYGEGSFLVQIVDMDEGENTMPEYPQDVMDLDDFVEFCQGYAETINGWCNVESNGDNQYLIKFYTSDTTFAEDDQKEDPYYEEYAGALCVELIYPYTKEMADYIENPR